MFLNVASSVVVRPGSAFTGTPSTFAGCTLPAAILSTFLPCGEEGGALFNGGLAFSTGGRAFSTGGSAVMGTCIDNTRPVNNGSVSSEDNEISGSSEDDGTFPAGSSDGLVTVGGVRGEADPA